MTGVPDELVEKAVKVGTFYDQRRHAIAILEAVGLPALLERVEAMRATNTRLNARLTKAEAAMTTTIEDCRRQGVSLGRGLANAGFQMVEAERDALAAKVARVEALCENPDYDETPDPVAYVEVDRIRAALTEGTEG